jgi:hypothetical protein
MIITAESIIAGFMIAYAALVSQMLVSWSKVLGASLFTTFQAGLLTSLVVLTCFQSILFLYRSTGPLNRQPNIEDFQTGYDLFIAALLGTGIYVILNIISWYRFYLLMYFSVPNPKPISIPYELPVSFCELVLSILYTLILLHKPKWIQKRISSLIRGNGRRIAEPFGWAGLAVLVAYILLCTLH